jgi:hypothetical protein
MKIQPILFNKINAEAVIKGRRFLSVDLDLYMLSLFHW